MRFWEQLVAWLELVLKAVNCFLGLLAVVFFSTFDPFNRNGYMTWTHTYTGKGGREHLLKLTFYLFDIQSRLNTCQFKLSFLQLSGDIIIILLRCHWSVMNYGKLLRRVNPLVVEPEIFDSVGET